MKSCSLASSYYLYSFSSFLIRSQTTGRSVSLRCSAPGHNLCNTVQLPANTQTPSAGPFTVQSHSYFQDSFPDFKTIHTPSAASSYKVKQAVAPGNNSSNAVQLPANIYSPSAAYLYRLTPGKQFSTQHTLYFAFIIPFPIVTYIYSFTL